MTRTCTGQELAARLQERYPDAVIERGAIEVWVSPESILDVVTFLKGEPGLDFNYLNHVTAVDFVEYFEMVYYLTSFQHNHSAVIKARVYGREEPSMPSIVGVWPGADFQEREIWDLMGVSFAGHPNLKRIMLWEGFEGHPQRKDFKDSVEY
jgi:NADH/F420H2 dehydrogenase subunit C